MGTELNVGETVAKGSTVVTADQDAMGTAVDEVPVHNTVQEDTVTTAEETIVTDPSHHL